MKAKLIKVLQQLEVESMALILESDQLPVWILRKAQRRNYSLRNYVNPLIVWLQDEREMHQIQVLLDEALILAREILDCPP